MSCPFAVQMFICNDQSRTHTQLRFKFKQTVLTAEIHIDHQDFVAWIMQAIFEDRTFAIHPDYVPTRWK